MTEGQNPFEALGAGGFDMNALLQQAQQMQEQLAEAQQQLRDADGRGQRRRSVTVKVNGIGELTAVDIRPGALRRLRPRGPGRPRRHDRRRLPRRQGPGRRPGRRGARPPRRGPRAGSAAPRRSPGSARVPGHVLVYEGVVQDLIDELGRLPGVGPKSAQRIAFHLLQAEESDVRRLAEALIEVKARGAVLLDLLQRLRGRAVPDLPRPAARPDRALRGRGVQGRRRHRADPRVQGPLPRARRRDLADRRHRPGPAAHPRADDAALRRHGHRGDPRDGPEPRGRGDRDLPHPYAAGPLGLRSPGSPAGSRSAATWSTPTRSRSDAPSAGRRSAQ